MNTLFTNLLSNQTTTDILVLGVAFIVFFFFLRREFRHEIKTEIAPIKATLDNHITETNKKIDQLSSNFDKLSDRFDRQNDQFSRLYEILLKDKQQK